MYFIRKFLLCFSLCFIGICAVYAQPVNNSFNDDVFYKCIIEQYNYENGTSYDITYNLDDNELKKITSISCWSKKITDFSGIETLENLETIFLLPVAAEKIDLSKNLALKDVQLVNYFEGTQEISYLESVNVSKNINLEHLRIDSDLITNIDISNNVNLKSLQIWSSNLNELDLSNNSLNELSLASNKIKSLDLSKQIDLKSLKIYDSSINEIDLSNNIELEELAIQNGKLIDIDLSNNLKLTNLNLSNNNLKKIDLSNNKLLDKIYIYGNEFMSSIDINQVGDYILLSDYIKLPYGYNFNYQVNNDDIVKVDGDKIVGLRVGTVNGTLTICNTINQVIMPNEEVGSAIVIDGIRYKYVIEDIKFDSIITVLNNKDNENIDNDRSDDSSIKDDTNQENNVNNPETDVYTGSFLIIIIVIISYMIVKKKNNFNNI